MKNWIKSMAIMVVILMMVGMAGCGQSQMPKTPEPPTPPEEAKDKIEGETPDEAGKGDGGDKLAPNPAVEVKEGMDYIVLDVAAKDFELEDLEGNAVKLSDYKDHIIFLNFWATWCPPCREEMPDMEEIHKEYGDKGVAILAVSATNLELRGGSDSQKAKKQVEKFINENKFTFPVLLDADDSVVMAYNEIYAVSGIPTTFLIDKNGQIRYARPGAFTGKEQLEAFIALLED